MGIDTALHRVARIAAFALLGLIAPATAFAEPSPEAPPAPAAAPTYTPPPPTYTPAPSYTPAPTYTPPPVSTPSGPSAAELAAARAQAARRAAQARAQRRAESAAAARLVAARKAREARQNALALTTQAHAEDVMTERLAHEREVQAARVFAATAAEGIGGAFVIDNSSEVSRASGGSSHLPLPMMLLGALLLAAAAAYCGRLLVGGRLAPGTLAALAAVPVLAASMLT